MDVTLVLPASKRQFRMSRATSISQCMSVITHKQQQQQLQLYPLSPYFNIVCSFASSFFCRSMTPRMIFLSSSVRWLRSGMSPAAEAAAAAAAAAAGPGPPRGPCGADIFYTQLATIKTRKALSTSSIPVGICVTKPSNIRLEVGFAGGSQAA